MSEEKLVNKKITSDIMGVVFLAIIVLIPVLSELFAAISLSNTYYDFEVFDKYHYTMEDCEEIADIMNEVLEEEYKKSSIFVDCDGFYTPEFVHYYMHYTLEAKFTDKVPEVDEEYVRQYVYDNVVPIMKQIPGYTSSYNEDFVKQFVDMINNEGVKAKVSSEKKMYEEDAKGRETRVVICGIVTVIIIVVLFLKTRDLSTVIQSIGAAMIIACGRCYVTFSDVFKVFKKGSFTAVLTGEEKEIVDKASEMVVSNTETLLAISKPYFIAGVVIGILLLVVPAVISIFVKKPQTYVAASKPQIINDKYDDLDDFLAQEPVVTSTPKQTTVQASSYEEFSMEESIDSMNVNTNAFGNEYSFVSDSVKKDSEYSFVSASDKVNTENTFAGNSSESKSEEKSLEEFSSLFSSFNTTNYDNKL